MEKRFDNDLDSVGYCLISEAIGGATLQAWSDSLESVLHKSQRGTLSSRDKIYGSRNLLGTWPGVDDVRRHTAVKAVVDRILGDEAGLVRVLFFDKPPGRSWSLPWHRDMTIAVREHRSDLGPFRCPTVKSGQPHVEAPTWLLRQMVTLRIHLDPMTATNGPLVVMPGSHRGGELEIREAGGKIMTIFCAAGSIFVMRPLLAHSSRNSAPDSAARRRILHLEFAATENLPSGYQWQQYVKFDS
jgi:hypothetical protein